MAIKNTKLGGTDWVDNESIKYNDVNDTFDAAAEKVKTLSTFWLNSYLYTVYDDFESYSVGDFTDNANWDVTVSGGTSTCTIVSSTNAGGTGKEVKLFLTHNNTAKSTIQSLLIPSNRHIFARLSLSNAKGVDSSPEITISFGNATDGWTTIKEHTDFAEYTACIFIVAKGGDLYDIYWGGYKVSSDLSKPNGAQIKISAHVDGSTIDPSVATIYVDDVRYSGSEIV